MKTASKEYKNELTKYFQTFQTRFENGLRNTSKTDPKKFWGILNRIDRSSEKEKISIDNFYEYFKDLNNYNDINDESEFDITYDNDFINSSIAGNADDILNSAITEDEIRIAIKDLKNNKASGIGEIINEYLKSTVSQMMPELYLMHELLVSLYQFIRKRVVLLILTTIEQLQLFQILSNYSHPY